jgi:glycosyltransferase involved in cell wall biosynthesis
MRILIHDFAGHPFQVQLSRELARRGHVVMHAFPLGLPGPKGRLSKSPGDPDRFSVHPIPLSATFSKYSPLKRLISQRRYASDLKALIRSESPDVVLSGNTPIDIQAELSWQCRRLGVGFVHWVQDVYYHAIHFFFRRKFGGLAALFSFPFEQLEKSVARKSDGVVVISPSFRDIMAKWNVQEDKISVLENWAPLDEVTNLQRNNDWSAAQSLNGKTVFLYSGSMGLKHRPDLIYKMAECLDHSCKVVAVTEGVGRAYLESRPRRENLLLLDFQPYDKLSSVLATADVLVATLEPDAGIFAVPSKILAYLCAGRPIVLFAPESNLAARVIKRSGAGVVVNPADPKACMDAVALLASDPELRVRLGRNARSYAEKTFDIETISAAFEERLIEVSRRSPAKVPALEKGAVEA